MPIKLRVLYMEDDADTRDMVNCLMEKSDIVIKTAESVKEAERMATSDEFDIFLLDGMIPFQNSLALCQRLRTLAPGTPVLFYSGFAGTQDIARGLGAGAIDYLVKPYAGDLKKVLWQAAAKSSVYAAHCNPPSPIELRPILPQPFTPGSVIQPRDTLNTVLS